MRITVAKSAGFCFGVDKAVSSVERLLSEGRSVATLGPIIHNDIVVDDLAARGAIAVDSPEQTPDGSVLVIRSHGVPAEIFSQCEELGIETLDATCPHVKKIHRIVGENNTQKRAVLIAGDASHPEVMGIIGHCVDKSYVFGNEIELKEKIFKKTGDIPCIIVAQTTFNLLQYRKCVDCAKTLYSDIETYDTVCGATAMRQREARELAQSSDVCIVAGGSNSSNTRKLRDICAEYAPTYLVGSSRDLRREMFAGANSVGVTAGASTPAPLIEEVLIYMSEIINDEAFNFEEALEDSLKPVHRNQRVKGIVTEIRSNEVVVDIGTKQTGFVPADEMSDDNAKLEDLVKIGDEINLMVIKVNDQEGIITLSKKRVDSAEGLSAVAEAAESGEIVDAYVTEVVEKGLVATVKGVRVFIPASQATLYRGEPFDGMLHTNIKIKIIEYNPQRRRAIGSIRAILQAERDAKRDEFWSKIQVGDKFAGKVKSLTSYGAFVDLGGVDGMVHISELSWQRVRNPADVVAVGDDLDVYVKEIDTERRRISLGHRREEDNPWTVLKNTYAVGDIFESTVVSLTKFGAFVKVIPGIDGLVHISEISNDRVEKTSDVLEVGQTVNVKLIGIDYDRKRVSLTMKLDAPVEEEAAE